jgi:hypothetical protein
MEENRRSHWPSSERAFVDRDPSVVARLFATPGGGPRAICRGIPEVEEMAAFFEATLRGMAVKARDGVSVDCLLKVARVAMRAWPTAKGDAARK